MAIDIIARGLASSLIGTDGKIATDKMPTLDAVPEGTVFSPIGQLTDASLIAGKTAEEILLMMLYGVVSPTLTGPSLSIALNDDNETPVIGRTSVLRGTLSFDRGKIEPAFVTSGHRAGAATNYFIGETVLPATGELCDFKVEVNPTDTTVYIPYAVAYSEGDQPVNSIGQPIGAPYSAGTISSILSIPAAYALYNAAGQELNFTWFTDETGSGYLSAFASEGKGTKQSFSVSANVSVIGIKAFDPLSQAWQWLGGSAMASLKHFDATIISGESLGETSDYILYTHNQPAKGARELRIYII